MSLSRTVSYINDVTNPNSTIRSASPPQANRVQWSWPSGSGEQARAIRWVLPARPACGNGWPGPDPATRHPNLLAIPPFDAVHHRTFEHIQGRRDLWSVPALIHLEQDPSSSDEPNFSHCAPVGSVVPVPPRPTVPRIGPVPWLLHLTATRYRSQHRDFHHETQTTSNADLNQYQAGYLATTGIAHTVWIASDNSMNEIEHNSAIRHFKPGQIVSLTVA